MTRARILKLAGSAVVALVALDLIATAVTVALGWQFIKR